MHSPLDGAPVKTFRSDIKIAAAPRTTPAPVSRSMDRLAPELWCMICESGLDLQDLDNLRSASKFFRNICYIPARRLFVKTLIHRQEQATWAGTRSRWLEHIEDTKTREPLRTVTVMTTPITLERLHHGLRQHTDIASVVTGLNFIITHVACKAGYYDPAEGEIPWADCEDDPLSQALGRFSSPQPALPNDDRVSWRLCEEGALAQALGKLFSTLPNLRHVNLHGLHPTANVDSLGRFHKLEWCGVCTDHPGAWGPISKCVEFNLDVQHCKHWSADLPEMLRSLLEAKPDKVTSISFTEEPRNTWLLGGEHQPHAVRDNDAVVTVLTHMPSENRNLQHVTRFSIETDLSVQRGQMSDPALLGKFFERMPRLTHLFVALIGPSSFFVVDDEEDRGFARYDGSVKIPFAKAPNLEHLTIHDTLSRCLTDRLIVELVKEAKEHVQLETFACEFIDMHEEVWKTFLDKFRLLEPRVDKLVLTAPRSCSDFICYRDKKQSHHLANPLLNHNGSGRSHVYTPDRIREDHMRAMLAQHSPLRDAMTFTFTVSELAKLAGFWDERVHRCNRLSCYYSFPPVSDRRWICSEMATAWKKTRCPEIMPDVDFRPSRWDYKETLSEDGEIEVEEPWLGKDWVWFGDIDDDLSRFRNADDEEDEHDDGDEGEDEHDDEDEGERMEGIVAE